MFGNEEEAFLERLSFGFSEHEVLFWEVEDIAEVELRDLVVPLKGKGLLR